MRRKARVTLIAFSVICLVGIAGGAIFASTRSSQPDLVSSAVLGSSDRFAAPSGVTVSSPTTEAVGSAKVTAEDALRIAWTEEGAPGDVAKASATFLMFGWGKADPEPAWVITYPDACVLQHGGVLSSGGSCLAIPFNVVVDASTGDVLMSYAVSEGGYETIGDGSSVGT